jgi:hypothetical protein
LSFYGSDSLVFGILEQATDICSKDKVVGSPETLVTICWTARCHNPNENIQERSEFELFKQKRSIMNYVPINKHFY